MQQGASNGKVPSLFLVFLPSDDVEIAQAQHKRLVAEDDKIKMHNKRLRTTHETLQKNQRMVEQREEAIATIDHGEVDQRQHDRLTADLTKAQAIMAKTQGNYQKLVTSMADLLNTGSGRVPLEALE